MFPTPKSENLAPKMFFETVKPLKILANNSFFKENKSVILKCWKPLTGAYPGGALGAAAPRVTEGAPKKEEKGNGKKRLREKRKRGKEREKERREQKREKKKGQSI